MNKQTLVTIIGMTILLVAVPAAANLDVVFLLDTTGSMASEIREVKERVVQLSTALETSRKGETVRFGVVAYRDRGDAYVTKRSPLSADVGESERFLGILVADGGGDGPEDVLSGLRDALERMKWAKGHATERQIFLIGDAPPHLDYTDGPGPEALIRIAREQKIVINAIGCRSLSVDGIRFFRTLAYGTEGRYQHIGRVESQTKGVADAMLNTLVSTPDELDLTSAREVKVHRIPERDARSDSDVILVQHETVAAPDASRRCAVSVHWPAHLAPEGDPRVFTHSGKLVWILNATVGTGKTEWFQLADCTLSNAPIQVRIGGAK